MISDETDFPYARTALMYVFMGHLKFDHTRLFQDHFWDASRIVRTRGKVTAVDTGLRVLTLDNGSALSYDKLIIATGSRPGRLHIPGEDLEGVQGLYHLWDLHKITDRARKGIRRAVITGGGLIGVELAEMLHSARVPVTMVIREGSYWANVLPTEESKMVTKHILQQGIEIREVEELAAIHGKEGTLSSVVCKNSGEEIPCDFCGITIGVEPNVDVFKGTNIRINKGIMVNEYLETSCENVLAAGDCAEISAPTPGRRPTEAVWYAARAMGETVAGTIIGPKTSYEPGVWFNSAKFFDIGYQVYGEAGSSVPEGVASVFWKHPAENKSIRINFDTKTGAVLGFTLMGIRYRQDVCVKWVREARQIDYVIDNLHTANFDPEFYTKHEKEAVRFFKSELIRS